MKRAAPLRPKTDPSAMHILGDLVALLLPATIAVASAAGPGTPSHGAELAPRVFLNPILGGDHPDPSILRDGADFYLVHSSFESYPGC